MDVNKNEVKVIGDILKLTYGQEQVGLTFNPSMDSDVDIAKQSFADMIDMMQKIVDDPNATSRKKRQASIAITEIESVQMRVVKAITFKY